MTKVFQLPNGVTGICEERPGAGKVAMEIYFRLGAMHEAAADNGLTNLTRRASLGGTTTRAREQIAEQVESRGGEIESGTARDGTHFASETLTRYAADVFEILADVVRNPVFPAKEVDKAKAAVRQNLAAQEQSAGALAARHFSAVIFAGQSMARDPLGTAETLKSFTPEDLKRRHAEMLADPSRIIVSFAGDIETNNARGLLQEYFGDLKPAAVPMAEVATSFVGGESRIANTNEQLTLLLGFPAPATNSPDAYAAGLLEEALAGGMSAPLFQEIREKRGLVYSVGAEYSALQDCGLFGIAAGTGKGNAGELVAVTFDLLGSVIRDGFDETALTQARQRLMRKLKDARETIGDAGTNNLTQWEEHGRLIEPAEVEARLKAVTNDDIRRVCAGFLASGGYALSGVGPLETLPSETEIKAMMAAQLKDVVVPGVNPLAENLLANFAAAAGEKEESTVAPQITTLANGMMVLTVERPGNLSCGAWVGAGSDHETPALNGATHMNEHMMFKGTPSYPAGSIDRIVEGELGGGLNAYTTKDRTCYYFFSLEASALEKTVDICGEMIFQANLDHEEFDGKTVVKRNGKTAKNKGERDVVLEELRRANDNVRSRRMDLLMEAAYPDQPHGWTVLGPENTLRALTVQQLAAYRDEFYTPNNVVFAAVGPVTHADFVAIIEKKFGAMKPGRFPGLPVPAYKGGASTLEMSGAKLCNIGLAAPAVSRTDDDFYAWLAFSAILGEGQSSRLYLDVVGDKALTADISSGLMEFRNGGTFLIMAATAPENAKPLIAAVYAQIRGMAQQVTAEELAKAKTALEMSILASFETNEDACDEYATAAQAFGRLVLPTEISGEIQKLTAEDIRRVAASIIAANPTAALIVPPGTDEGLLPQQRDLLAMRDAAAFTDASTAPAAATA